MKRVEAGLLDDYEIQTRIIDALTDRDDIRLIQNAQNTDASKEWERYILGECESDGYSSTEDIESGIHQMVLRPQGG